jgi:hypothetical protein
MAMTADQAPLTVIAFTTAFAAVAAGVWNRGLIRPALIVAAVVIWVTGEQFGAIFTARPPTRTPGRCSSSSLPRSGRCGVTIGFGSRPRSFGDRFLIFLNGPVVPPARSRPP